MKKFILAFATAAGLFGSSSALAQKMPSANDAMRYDEARDPAYRAAVRSGYNYGRYGGNYGYGPAYGLIDSVACLLLCHKPNPVRDNTAKVGGAYYKACNGDPAVPINVPCNAPVAAASDEYQSH